MPPPVAAARVRRERILPHCRAEACSGCHGLETGSGHVNNTGNAFAMVLPRHYRQRSEISSFISGVAKDGQPYQVQDPANNNVKRSFNEFKIRQNEMWNLIYR